jgi:hypothetical protein
VQRLAIRGGEQVVDERRQAGAIALELRAERRGRRELLGIEPRDERAKVGADLG